MIIDTPIDQVNTELVYGMIQCPKWYPINYTVGGFYDRCLENFRKHAREETLTDNDKYDWVRIPTTSNIHTIWLAKPGKEVKKKPKMVQGRYGFIEKELWTNVVRMDLFLYRSMAEPGVQGFTFGDRQHILKPLKILHHKWIRRTTEAWNDFHAFQKTGSEVGWICDKCGLTGHSHMSNKAALIPDRLLTCDEVCVADIIL